MNYFYRSLYGISGKPPQSDSIGDDANKIIDIANNRQI